VKLTPENCAYHARGADGKLRDVYRLGIEGFSAVVDGDFEEIAGRLGATIRRVAESDTVGTLAAALREYEYETRDGRTMYAYTIISVGGDTWCEEWVTSCAPLTSQEAANLIFEGRRIAHEAPPLTIEQAEAAGFRSKARL